LPGSPATRPTKLALAGYHTVQLPSTTLADAPSQAYYTTNVYYDAVQPNAKQARSS